MILDTNALIRLSKGQSQIADYVVSKKGKLHNIFDYFC